MSCFENGLCFEKQHFETNFENGQCCVHICWWWLYMLCAYMLMVIIYVECIYVDGDYILCVPICCWWNLLHANWWIVGVRMYWNIIGVDLWNYMKYLLLFSSPNSHTLLLLSFISNCSWMLRYSLFGVVIWGGYKRQGRRPRRWKKFGTTHSWVGLVKLYVSRKSHVCSWAWCEYMLILGVLDDCCDWNLVLV